MAKKIFLYCSSKENMKIAFNSSTVLFSFCPVCFSLHLRAVLVVGRWLVIAVGVMETTHTKKATLEPPFGDEEGCITHMVLIC